MDATAPINRQKSAQADWLRALQSAARISRDPALILPRAFDAVAATHGARIALVSDTGSWTFADLADRSNRYARWGIANHLAIGDVVGLMLDNCPEYVAIWLGLTRIGVIVALYHPRLIGPSLAHCIAASSARLIIAGANHAPTCADALAERADPPAICAIGTTPAHRRLDADIAATSGAALTDDEARDIRQTHHALTIFTSGTTGLPKAAIVSHRRVMHWAGWFNALIDPMPGDRMYNCLPMSHALGGVVAVWATLLGGGSVAIRPRFSAMRFWSDIVALDCTLFQYIGELCRYLVTAAPDPAERRHRLRLVLGNGLRADIWQPFLDRFAIPRVIEFYAATESTFSLYNLEGEPGAIGRIPAVAAVRQDIRLVRFDPDTGAPARSADGFCQLAGVDEPGEAIARIAGDGHAAFEGYLDRAATDARILHDVFRPGDRWLRSGDLMRKDARGFWYFVDRVGDTFRWKGENVATAEVAAAILGFPGVIDVQVSSVALPGTDGRAGVATIVPGDGFEIAGLAPHLGRCLPPHAHPVFVRLTAGLTLTDTFRHRRQRLEPADLAPVLPGDRLFALDAGQTRYRPVDRA